MKVRGVCVIELDLDEADKLLEILEDADGDFAERLHDEIDAQINKD